MSNESLRMLTSDFKESLVRRVVAVAPSLRDQGIILDKIEETVNEYNRCYYEYNLAWLNSANETIQNIRFDLECDITIKVESEQNDFQNNMDDSAEFTPITVEEFEKKLSKTENSTTNDNNTVQAEDLKARIKELEEENEQLRKENEELKEYKALMDTPLDGIEADSKVGLAIIKKLMKNDGANFEKSKNKTIGAQALKMMTGRSESACKQIFSVPLSKSYHAKKICELNGYLQELGMKTLL